MGKINEKDNWELHRKGISDQKRHKRRIKEAIRTNPERVLQNQNIITAKKNKKVKVPLRSLAEYRFEYAKRQRSFGQGDGNSQEGDTIAKAPKQGKGKDGDGGEGDGGEVYEAEVDLEEVKKIIFDELDLPYLDPNKKNEIESEDQKYKGRGKTGIIPNLDKRETIKENLKRQISKGNETPGDLHDDDLRYKKPRTDTEKTSNAVVYVMRDSSGSMRKKKKFLSRSLAWWIVEFLHTQYTHLDIHFILHTNRAEFVDEQAFFERSESGGTKISSAYEKMHDHISDNYNPQRWNLYGFHFSDGENRSGDQKKAIELLEKLCDLTRRFGFCSIQPRSGDAPMDQVNPDVLKDKGPLKDFINFTHPSYAFSGVVGEEDLPNVLERLLAEKLTSASIGGEDNA